MKKSVILCVDDEKVILDSLKIQIRNEFQDKFYYETAECANDALEIIEELQEDDINILIIVSDWLMPGMKGDEFLIQVHQSFPDIVKVMLTGQADQKAVERAKRHANLHALLQKPWKKDDLIQVLKSGMSLL